MTRALRYACALALAGVAPAAEKPAWEFATRPADRRVAFTKIAGKSTRGPLDATLVFSRSGDAQRKPVRKNNVTTSPLAIELWVSNAKQTVAFDLNDYEGPDAPSGSMKLVTVTLITKGKPWTRKWTASGWFSPLQDPAGGGPAQLAAGEPEMFVFGLGDVLKDYRDLVQLADFLSSGSAESLVIELAPKAKGPPPLRIDVPLAGASEAVRQLMSAK